MKFVIFALCFGLMVHSLSALEQPMPEATVSIGDLILAIQTGEVSQFLGKDLTVTGIGMLPMVNPSKIDGAFDGKQDSRVAFSPFNIEVPSGTVGKEVAFFLPVALVAKHPILKQSLVNRLRVEHVFLVKHTQFLTKDLYFLFPLDTFTVVDGGAVNQ